MLYTILIAIILAFLIENLKLRKQNKNLYTMNDELCNGLVKDFVKNIGKCDKKPKD